MTPALRDWLCRELRPLVDVRFCAPPPDGAGGSGRAPLLRIGLWTGVFIHAHCLTEAPGTRQLRRILQRDEEASCASLFLLAPALVPGPGQAFAAPDWLLALHSLGHERLTVCAAPGSAPGLQTVQLEAVDGGQRHRAHYGAALRPQKVHTGRVAIRMRRVRGFWNIAHFGGGATQRFAEAAAQGRPAPEQSGAHMEGELARSYALLGLGPEASRQAAHEAFRRQALSVHPDVSALPTALAEERFRALTAAWERIRHARGWS